VLSEPRELLELLVLQCAVTYIRFGFGESKLTQWQGVSGAVGPTVRSLEDCPIRRLKLMER